MSGLFDEVEDQPHACVECRFFAGNRRDHRAFLFRTARGYCDHPRHPGGIWNVIQSITVKRHRPLYEAAEENVKEMRHKALKHYGVIKE